MLLMGDVFVEFDGVGKRYPGPGGGVEAVSGVDLSIERGEFCALVGPSGCGKSTLLLTLAGLTQPTSGEVRIAGRVVAEPYTDLGIVFQNAELLPWRDALSNVTLQAEVRKQPKEPARRRALELMKQVGLEGFEKRYPDELSGGMAQRVSLCRALLHDPDVMVMDEPFGALDALTRDQIQLDMQRLWMASRKTVVLVTHSIEEAVFLADRIVVFTPRPARVAADIRVPLDRPRHIRDRTSPEFIELVGRIRDIFTDLGVFEEAVA
jgi:NitT/TauT family transport system ATP-binding protein